MKEHITIEDWQYHATMLDDIAKKNNAAMILRYTPNPHEKCMSAIALNGYPIELMAQVAVVIDHIADMVGRKPSEVAQIICNAINDKEKQ